MTSSAIVLSLTGPEASFSQRNVMSMLFGNGAKDCPQFEHVLILELNEETVLAIPWPDGLALDEALLAWAETVSVSK